MTGLGLLSFAAPWALAALVTLPLLWLLLRVTPPSPRRQTFPALRLLFGLKPAAETPARMPWWLVALRMLVALLVVLAVARPLWNAPRAEASGGPLLLVVDDGWAAARGWTQRRATLDALLAHAERESRAVILMATAPPADGGPILAGRMTTAAQARDAALALTPKPWPSDHGAARDALKEVPREKDMRVAWLSDGLENPPSQGFMALLRTFGRLEVLADPPAAAGRVLLPPSPGGDLAPLVRRLGSAADEVVVLRAADGAGRTVARQQALIPAGRAEMAIRLDVPSELRNRIQRLDIDAEASAAAVVLVDERWRRRPVGLVGGEAAADTPLLSDLYYVERALAPFAELRRGAIDELLKRDLAVMVLSDANAPSQAEQDALADWIGNGGVLARFAGPRLARDPDDLLPVRIRGGSRTLGGSLSWTEPMGLAAFPPGTPFAGLTIPGEVRIESQVLAEPEARLNDKAWARLTDGTPLVTAERRGKGWLVLVHTTANPAWSNLSLSGLFVDMLRRLVVVSQGIAGEESGRSLPPVELLDGYGRLGTPSANAVAIAPGALASTRPEPRHPPGFYGEDIARRALNLGPSLPPLKALAVPPGVTVSLMGQARPEIDLRPWLLGAALTLAVFDFALGLALRGLFSRRHAARAAAGLVLLLAAGVPGVGRAAEDPFAAKAALETRLAFVRTGDAASDRVSQAGLAALSKVVAGRTTAALGEPMGVDVEHDPLMFFPILYWPTAASQMVPSPAAQARLVEYMRHGGLIVFDTGDGAESQGPGARHLAQFTQSMTLPPLVAVDEDHVLTRSYYLLKDLPGRFAGGTIWVERTDRQINDGVSALIVGGHDWAGAWALDDLGRPLLPVVPGGEMQREMAYRFGVNLVMYALTGNYKSDQVHLPAILERLRP